MGTALPGVGLPGVLAPGAVLPGASASPAPLLAPLSCCQQPELPSAPSKDFCPLQTRLPVGKFSLPVSPLTVNGQ